MFRFGRCMFTIFWVFVGMLGTIKLTLFVLHDPRTPEGVFSIFVFDLLMIVFTVLSAKSFFRWTIYGAADKSQDE